MDRVALDCALRIVLVCLAETSVEIVVTSIFVWVLSTQGPCIYPVMSVLANVLRLGLAAAFMRDLSRTRYEEQPFDGWMSSTRLVSSRVPGFWRLTMIVQSAWNFVMLVQTYGHGGWVFYTVALLTVVNAQVCCLSLCLFLGPLEPAIHPMVGKSFEHPGKVRAGSSLRFGTSCRICFSELEEGQLVSQLTCGHAFHEACIQQWLALKESCPMRCSEPKAAAIGAVDRGTAAEVMDELGDIVNPTV